MGNAATKIKQGFTHFIYKKMKNKFKEKLKNKKIVILGIAFKTNIDDTRDSLSIDLFKFLKKKKFKVKISDEFVKMNEIIDKKKLIKESDIIILGVPHSSYKKLKIPKNKYLVDTWGFFEK